MEKENKTETKKTGLANDKIWAIIAYVFFPLPWIFVKNKTPFLKYHINQGIILFVVATIAQISFGFLPSLISLIVKIFLVIEFIYGISYSVKKEMKPLPLIGDWFNVFK